MTKDTSTVATGGKGTAIERKESERSHVRVDKREYLEHESGVALYL